MSAASGISHWIDEDTGSIRVQCSVPSSVSRAPPPNLRCRFGNQDVSARLEPDDAVSCCVPAVSSDRACCVGLSGCEYAMIRMQRLCRTYTARRSALKSLAMTNAFSRESLTSLTCQGELKVSVVLRHGLPVQAPRHGLVQGISTCLQRMPPPACT